MADLTGFIPSLLSPLAPIIPGYQGQGRADLADMIDKDRLAAQEEAFKQKQLGQQGDIAAATNATNRYEAESKDAYYKLQDKERQDALAAKAKAERDKRVAALRDMEAKARRIGDVSTAAMARAELGRMGWSIKETGPQAPPSSLSPAGLPDAPPAPAPGTMVLGDQNANEDVGVPEAEQDPRNKLITADNSVNAPAELKDPDPNQPDVISGPSSGKAPMVMPEQPIRAALPAPASLAPGGLPQAPAATHPANYYKLSPEGQAALAEVLKANPGLTESQALGVFGHESQMNAKIPNGVGNTGLYQLSDKQAPGLVGKPHLSDLSDAEQVRSYPNYLKKTGLNTANPVNNTDLILAQIAPSKIGARDPNAIIYTPQEVAGWNEKTRAINAPMVGPDGAVRLGSLLKGYQLNDGGKASPDAVSAASVLSPGGLPSTPPAPKGGRFEYRDETGNLVDTYDQGAEDDRVANEMKLTLEPLVSGAGTPREKAAAQRALDYGTRAAKVVGQDKALKLATDMYEKQSKEPSVNGQNGAAALEQRRLINNDSQSAGIIKEIDSTDSAKAVNASEAQIKQGIDLLHSGSGFADKTALAQLTSGLFGKNQSNDEYTRTLNSDGFFSGLQNKINKFTDGGRLDDALRGDLEKFFVITQKAINQRRQAMGDEAYHRVMTSLSVGTPEERRNHAEAARAYFTRQFDDGGDAGASPAAEAPAPQARPLPAAPRITAPVEGAAKALENKVQSLLKRGK